MLFALVLRIQKLVSFDDGVGDVPGRFVDGREEEARLVGLAVGELVALGQQVVRDALAHHRVVLVVGVLLDKLADPTRRRHQLT